MSWLSMELAFVPKEESVKLKAERVRRLRHKQKQPIMTFHVKRGVKCVAYKTTKKKSVEDRLKTKEPTDAGILRKARYKNVALRTI